MNDQKAKIGYFDDSGTHTLANMGYASLAYIHEFPESGKHEYRPVIGQIKPMRGSGSDKKIYENILKSYFSLGSRVTSEEVLDSIGKVWNQKGRHIFGNTSLLVVTNNPTPLIDTGELKDNFGYRTTLNYTLRYA